MTYSQVEKTFDSYGQWFDHLVANNLKWESMVDNKIKSDAGVLIACWDAERDSGWVNYGTMKGEKG